ncbi:MAG: hypothetical protein NZ889_01720 [Candidatus Pacearchaeota archaeon]|nr:hypothetical protein [Candidatus Pacearchaeota archaeon]
MKIEFLSKKQKKEIKKMLLENYGIRIDMVYNLIKTGKNKIRFFTGEISEKELRMLNSLIKIESIGIPFLNLEKGPRLAFDAATLFGKMATKNFLELNKEQALRWMRGESIESEEEKERFLIIKYKGYTLGTGKIYKKKLLNFVPKERRTDLIDS